jgi:predicted Holliday junction resolvase-like endonuclease
MKRMDRYPEIAEGKGISSWFKVGPRTAIRAPTYRILPFLIVGVISVLAQPAVKQDTMSEPLGFLFLVLCVIATAVCIYLSMTMSHRVHAGITRWRNEEKQALETELRQLADADARLQFERWKQEHEQQIRMDAIQRSLAITKGKVTEHIVPYLPGFDLDPKDIRFLGTPIDLIAFKGLNASVEEVEIVFIEVKTGRSVLSAREKAVKKAVEEKKVSWRVFNPDVEVDRPTIISDAS